MATTYKAFEVSTPGVLKLVERPIMEPGIGQVRIRVEASGVCHSDALTIEGTLPGIAYPRVSGHEIAGYIEALGEGVERWQVGQRVGVGWFGGECGHCEPCRRGYFVNCLNLIVSGISTDGGYAEVVIAEARALAALPEHITAVEAAPLLCAGVTTFNALRNAKLRAGDLVAIQGIGGLGHLAVQFARRMGFHTVAIARGREKEQLARELGAHDYIDSLEQDAAQTLLQMGGANAILATAASGKSMGPLMAGLAPRGKLIVVGASPEPLEIDIGQLITGTQSIQGESVGTAIDEEDTLAFSALQSVHPLIELVPLENAPEAYARMMRNDARFRIVLTPWSSV
jgi:D-arabinose 1-dehydrogenase-like Zn-dependent alcohol dehydrogenase